MLYLYLIIKKGRCMYRTKRIIAGLFTLSFLLVTTSVAEKKMIPKDMRQYAPAGKMKKSHEKLKPKHLYVKDDEQLKKEFFYRKHKEKEFLKMKKRKEQHINQKRIEKNRKPIKVDNNE